MNMHESFTFTQPVMLPSNRTAPARPSRLKLLRMRLVAWLKKCADDYSDAVVYENLLRLSDAELKHRELSRYILARDVGRCLGDEAVRPQTSGPDSQADKKLA